MRDVLLALGPAPQVAAPPPQPLLGSQLTIDTSAAAAPRRTPSPLANTAIKLPGSGETPLQTFPGKGFMSGELRCVAFHAQRLGLRLRRASNPAAAGGHVVIEQVYAECPGKGTVEVGDVLLRILWPAPAAAAGGPLAPSAIPAAVDVPAAGLDILAATARIKTLCTRASPSAPLVLVFGPAGSTGDGALEDDSSFEDSAGP